jgi:hypothetical protein
MKLSGRSRFYLQVAAILFLASTRLGSGQTIEPPGAPQDFAISASGNRVTLTWRQPATGGAVAFYIIQVGSVSGGSDLGAFNVGGLTTVSASAPNGRYFVRVVAVNGSGSRSSSEVALLIGPPVLPREGLRCVGFEPYVAGYSPRHASTGCRD